MNAQWHFNCLCNTTHFYKQIIGNVCCVYTCVKCAFVVYAFIFLISNRSFSCTHTCICTYTPVFSSSSGRVLFVKVLNIIQLHNTIKGQKQLRMHCIRLSMWKENYPNQMRFNDFIFMDRTQTIDNWLTNWTEKVRKRKEENNQMEREHEGDREGDRERKRKECISIKKQNTQATITNRTTTWFYQEEMYELWEKNAAWFWFVIQIVD